MYRMYGDRCDVVRLVDGEETNNIGTFSFQIRVSPEGLFVAVISGEANDL